MNNRKKRHLRIRSKINGTNEIPRICVYKSNYYVYLQAINDTKQTTIASCTEKTLDKFIKVLLDKKINKIVFDRAGYKYHGKISKIADDLRKAGLKF